VIENPYQALFEPIKIGPVTAPNRFYQVPHCTGMGYQRPQTLASMRGIKAEGGWGVVCTEYCSIHSDSDDMPYPHASLWDQDDVNNLRMMTDAVHAHGALAGVELWYGGRSTPNIYSRGVSFGVQSLPSTPITGIPVQNQTMARDDISRLRQQHRDAAHRAISAGFDIIYVYANHGYLLNEFLSTDLNQRRDEYGGSSANRIRLISEIIEDTLEIVEGKAALAVRYSIPADPAVDKDNLVGMFSEIAELPDLWDITVTDYELEMGVSRFVKEAANQVAVAKIKSLTSKPIVSVGRFTSPDTMLRQIKSGVQDFIGAARPSIADPFLPEKIKSGRLDDIRECIGCNICYAHNSRNVPIRCTQNPTMGEEWRRGWHPEAIEPRGEDESVLIIGAGPSGLEAARALGQRGYEVILAEAETQLGGRINKESLLPGLSEWARVRDWRLGQLAKMSNVGIYPDNNLSAIDALDLDTNHIIVATGSSWRKDGIGGWRNTAFDGWQQDNVWSPDCLLGDNLPEGNVTIYDDDYYYMGPVLAMKLIEHGASVTIVTSASQVADFGQYTTEQHATVKTLLKAGVKIITDYGLESIQDNIIEFRSVYTKEKLELETDTLVPVSARTPNDALYLELTEISQQTLKQDLKSIKRCGDCRAPGMIAHAVYEGHKIARELGISESNLSPALRDRVIAI
jgi:dimethylamine/trimethylamine dehydrogenase